VFRALLRLLPGDFRSEFSDAMHADAGAMQANATSPRGRTAPMHGSTYWWTREIPGLVAAIVREHLSGFGADARMAARQLVRTPGFTCAALLMLAVGTGANAAVFSVVDAVILRPAFPDPARLVNVAEWTNDRTSRAPRIAAFRNISSSPMFAGAAGMIGRVFLVEPSGRGAQPGVARRITVECVSHTMFDVLGVHPALGRQFTADEDRAGAPPVIVISDRLWRRDFLASPAALGQTLSLGRTRSTIVGVMPPGFLGAHSQNDVEAWAPLEPSIVAQANAACRGPLPAVGVVARLSPGLTAAAAAAMPSGGPGSPRVTTRLDDDSFNAYRTPLIALMGTAWCVLLIACANVANLQLERLAGRRRELAVRLALGAGRWRVIRQTLTENMVLTAAGTAAGLGVASVTLRFLVRMMPPQLPHVGEITLDARVMVVAAAVAIVSGIAVGLVPAMQLVSADPVSLRGSERAVHGGAVWTRRGLVAGEVALSLVLLVGAVLMARSFIALRPDQLGFEPHNLMVSSTSLDADVMSHAEQTAFVDDVIQRLTGAPGVASVSATTYLPLRGYTETAVVTGGGSGIETWMGWTTAHYLADLGATLTAGRPFTASDGATSEPIAIINETLAQTLFPGASPRALGQIVDVAAAGQPPRARRIVGVVGDLREGGRDLVRRPEIYLPFAQHPEAYSVYFVVRTTDNAAPALAMTIREAVKAARPNQLLYWVEPMSATIDRAFARARFGAWLFGMFAAMAVALAALGLASVIAWSVTERRGEIGLRIALGATGTQIMGLVVRDSLAVTLAGALVGTGVAWAGSRLLAEWLFGVAPGDPVTISVAVAGMLVVGAIAAYLPARRAVRIDPAATLRAES
jgi:putative ABC transport system permease protein